MVVCLFGDLVIRTARSNYQIPNFFDKDKMINLINHLPLPKINFSVKYAIGIDIGGTFTDLVLLDRAGGRMVFGKTLTTYPDPSVGILNGVRQLVRDSGVALSQVHTIVHGTTLVTNAVIERKGAKTALLTTRGFEDVLEIGREMRYDIYDIFITMPKPLVPKALRKGLKERVDKNGAVLEPLDLEAAETTIRGFQKKGVRSIAVCLLHSYANPAHEKRVGELIRTKFPDMTYSLSCEVMPEIREYERCSATVMNAYVQPLMDVYLQKLRARLQVLGFDGVLHIMNFWKAALPAVRWRGCFWGNWRAKKTSWRLTWAAPPPKLP
jgi:N-methylhydantoinase A